MKIVGLSSSRVGTKTLTAMNYTIKLIMEKYPNAEVKLIDLTEYDVQFSDGRSYLEYEGDTGYVATTIMEADAIIGPRFSRHLFLQH
jgi:FMN reductase